MNSRSFKNPNDYRRFSDNNIPSRFHYYDNGDGVYNDSSYVNSNRSKHEFAEQRRQFYVPPTDQRNYPQENQRNYNNYANAISDEEDNVFVAVGRGILAALDDASRSATNEKELSVAKVLKLNKMMSVRELMEFNDELEVRLKRGMSTNRNGVFVYELAQECDRCFGDELRMLILRKESHSPQHQSGFTMQQEPFPGLNQNESIRRFGGLSREPVDIDLTNHIISEESHQSPYASERTYSFDYVDDKIYSGVTAETDPSSDWDFSDKEDVYTIEMNNIKKNGSPKSNQQRSQGRHSPTKVRFEKTETSNKASKKMAKQRPKLIGGREVVEVVAPATLPAGFMFEARSGDQVFMVVVPHGGVRKGQVFNSFKVDIDADAIEEPSLRFKTKVDMLIPLGHWRHNIFDCFRYGFLHPLLLNSIFCPHVALAQIMARMKLNFQGNRTMEIRSRVQLASVIFIPTIIFTLHGLLIYLVIRGFYLHLDSEFKIFFYGSIVVVLIDLFILCYFYVLLIKTRKQVRYAFNIPKECPKEDAFFSICCTPCTLTQMGQHTADYSTYVATCCSDTGLSRHVELKYIDEDRQFQDDRV